MHSKRVLSFIIAVFTGFLVAPTGPLLADVKLHGLFGDHMVLQRDMPIRVFGTAGAGEKVNVKLADVSAEATAGADCRWSVTLPARQAGGPCELSVNGAGNTVVVRDVLIGEVWVVTGQSNMAFTLGRIDKAKDAKPNAKLRFFAMFADGFVQPQEDVAGRWLETNPKNAVLCSAVGYFFAEKLQAELDVPVGLICAARGATHIEQWMDRQTYAAVGSGAKAYLDAWDANKDQILKDVDLYVAGVRAHEAKTAELELSGRKLRRAEQNEGAPESLKEADILGIKKPKGTPMVCYNAFIAPIVGFPVKGIAWYQGEFNCGVFGSEGPQEYAAKQRALVASWRKAWGVEHLPFLYVQLPNYQRGADPQRSSLAADGKWPQLRQHQLNATDVPHTAMAVSIDLGGGLHPGNKDVVGQRLALAALGNVYSQQILWSGPLVESVRLDGATVRVSFKHVGGGLIDKDGGELRGFCLKDAEGNIVEAQARIDGEEVVLAASGLGAPATVYYAYSDNPVCDLYNKEGLPASPFVKDLPGAAGATGKPPARQRKAN